MSTTTTVRVTGMSCQHCVAAVTEEVGAIDGVSTVTVDLATGDVVIASDAPIDRAVLADAIDEAGYSLDE